MRQLAATVQQTIWDARRCLRDAQKVSDVGQIALQQARLGYLTRLAAEYQIPATPVAPRAAGGSVTAR